MSYNILKVGDKAPDFSAKISESELIKLEDLKGKFIVLYFYPKDDTPGCTMEAKDFNDLRHDFASINAKIIGISKDSTESHQQFKGKYCLNFDLISDKTTEICKKFGVWGEKSMFGKKYMGIDRATFLLDPDGNIAHIWHKVSVQGHAVEVLEKIKELRK